jgi:hypothetical protein
MYQLSVDSTKHQVEIDYKCMTSTSIDDFALLLHKISAETP